MGQEYGLVYALISAFCALFAVIIFFKSNDDIGSEREIRYFRRMLIAYILFALSETVWALGNFDVVHLPVSVLTFISTVTIVAVGFLVFYWFAYGETKLGFEFWNHPVFKYVSLVPLVLATALCVVSLWTGSMFSYNENGMFTQGPLYTVVGVLYVSYAAAVSIHALVQAARATTASRRRECLTLFSFIIIPALATVFDAIWPARPVMAPALYSSILLVFANMQEAQIFNDALTGLNNRRRADAYLEELISKAELENGAFYLFIVDADRFKEVNDTYGHLEGDRALGAMAQALRATGEACKGFVARWGGDEFVILARENEIGLPEWVASEVDVQMHKAVASAGLPYELRATVGWARCDNAELNQDVLVRAADAMLYERKQQRRLRATKAIA